jgi:hypothetical protein
VAVTDSVDELPEVIEAGFAARVTVGDGFAMPTVTVTLAEAVPPVPVAVAVYVVVEIGAAVAVPPDEENVRLLPLVPSTVTEEAFVACTVRTVEPPRVIVVGFAVILIVGKAAAAAFGLMTRGETKARSNERGQNRSFITRP